MRLLVLMVVPLMLLGVDDITDPVSLEVLLKEILLFVTTVNGMAAMVIAAAVSQLLMLFFRSPLAMFVGNIKLIMVAIFSLGGLIMGALITGSNIVEAIGQEPVLVSMQVLVHQIWKQFFKKNG